MNHREALQTILTVRIFFTLYHVEVMKAAYPVMVGVGCSQDYIQFSMGEFCVLSIAKCGHCDIFLHPFDCIKH